MKPKTEKGFKEAGMHILLRKSKWLMLKRREGIEAFIQCTSKNTGVLFEDTSFIVETLI